MATGDRTERLLGLLFVLLSARLPVSKTALRAALPDYAQSPSDAAFERMFERDKEELRSMGVPIETVEGSVGAGGIDGYRVRSEHYALPEVAFTPEELTVLGLAAQVWEQASLGPAARSALRKLEASGVDAREDGVGVIARVTTQEPSFAAFLAASQARQPVRFDYRKPGADQPATRHLQPWGVVSRRGHWYVIGQDTDRGSARVFRLSRVVGQVRAEGAAGGYDAPPAADLTEMVARASDPVESSAVVRIRQGEAASLRRTATAVVADDEHPGWDRAELTYGDDESFATTLVGHGSAVVALAPPALREAVVRRLRAVPGALT